MKSCTECGAMKPIEEFYKNKKMADGRLNKCKACFSLYKKGYWLDNKERLQEYKRKHRAEKSEHYKDYAKKYRDDNIETIKAREKLRRSVCAEKIRKYDKEYSKSEKGKEIKKQIQKRYMATDKAKELKTISSKKYIERNPVKKHCHNLVCNAIKSGLLSPPEYCETCKDDKKLHAHHDDYEKALDVRWLCAKCHKDWHKENGEGLNSV